MHLRKHPIPVKSPSRIIPQDTIHRLIHDGSPVIRHTAAVFMVLTRFLLALASVLSLLLALSRR